MKGFFLDTPLAHLSSRIDFLPTTIYLTSSHINIPAIVVDMNTMKIETRLFINNEFVNSVSGKTFETINPATEKVICAVQEADKADVDLAVRIAHVWC